MTSSCLPVQSAKANSKTFSSGVEVFGVTLPVVAEVAVVVAFAAVFLTLAVRSLGRPD